MEERLTEPTTIQIPEDLQAEARNLIKRVFDLFADHSDRLAQDLADARKARDEARTRIRRGARRTTGRII